MDIWTPHLEHPPLTPVEILYDAGEKATVDVFAIHGLGSNPLSAWTYRGNGTDVRWLKDILPKVAGMENIRVAMVNHQTRWEANAANMRFQDHAAMILDDIESLHKLHSHRPVIFIAHSFGGLLLKEALILAKMRSSSVSSATKGILFLGVPHAGTKTAFGASLLSCTAYWRGSSSALLEYMAPGQPAIVALESRFYDTYVKKSSDSERPLPYICDFLEMRSERLGGLLLGPTVGRKSADVYHGDVVYLDTDHRGLNKFRSPQDPTFGRFLGYFQKALNPGMRHLGIGSSGNALRQHTEPRYIPPRPADSHYSDDFSIPFLLEFPDNSKFTGRELVLNQIHAQLGNVQSLGSGSRIFALYGPGGIGKTQIAIKYAHLHSAYFTSIFWIDATSELSTQQSFLRVGNRILKHYREQLGRDDQGNVARKMDLISLIEGTGRIPLVQSDTQKAIEGLMGWFASEGNKDWLLVFDNADDLETFDMRKYFPTAPWGSILLTTRRVPSSWEATEIQEMSESEGLQLLQWCAMLHHDLDSEGMSVATELLQILGYFPLAIAQAGAHVSVQIRSFSRTGSDIQTQALQRYLDSYKKKGRMLLEQKPALANWDYRNETVFTTWEVSFSSIAEKYPNAARLLLLCGFIGRTDILEEIFYYGDFGSDVDVHELVLVLATYSLVSFRDTADTFFLHPLIHFWAQERSDSGRQKALSRTATELLVRGLRLKSERDSVASFLAFEQRLLPHIHASFENSKRYFPLTKPMDILSRSNIAPNSLAGHIYQILEGWVMWLWGMIDDMARVVLSFSATDVESHLEIWQLVYELAFSYRKYSSWYAEQLYTWSLLGAIESRHLKHPAALTILGDLAWTVYNQRDYDRALDLYQWTLAVRSAVLGKTHPATLGAAKGVAGIYGQQGNYEPAMQLYLEALSGREKTVGRDDILTVNVVNDIGELLLVQGRPQEALGWYIRAQESTERTKGPYHLDTISAYLRLARLFQAEKEYDKASEWYYRALAGREIVFGDSHQDTLEVIQMIAGLFQDQNRYEEAFEYYGRALDAAEKSSRGDRTSLIEMCLNIGKAFHDRGRYDKALEWYNKVRVRRKQDPTNTDAATDMIEIIYRITEEFQAQQQLEAERFHKEGYHEWYHQFIVKLLVDPGVDVQATTGDGWTALHFASYKGHTLLAKLLLDKGAKVTVTNEGGLMPLHMAAYNGHFEVAKLLLESGANVTVADYKSRTPLHFAAFMGHCELINLLLENGANASLKNYQGWTPLNLAAYGGSVEAAKLLLETGADITVKNDVGESPLYSAASEGYTKVVELLLEAGSDAAAADNERRTPLISAAANGHTEVVKLLLEAGSDTGAADSEGWTPLISAGESGHVEIIKLLLEAGADMTTVDNGGWTALSSAANQGHTEAVKLLLEAGADMRTGTDGPWTPLHLAASHGYVETVKLLIGAGADVMAIQDNGWTPLHLAASNGYADTVKVLLENGADMTVTDYNGSTPLRAAARNGHAQVIHLLLGNEIHTSSITTMTDG